MHDEISRDMPSVGAIVPDLLADLVDEHPDLEARIAALNPADLLILRDVTPPASGGRHSRQAHSISTPPEQKCAPGEHCQRCNGSGVGGALPTEADDRQLVVIDRYNPGTPFERLYVFCPDCHAGQRRASGWMRLPNEARGVALDTLRAIPEQLVAQAAIELFVGKPRRWITIAGNYGVGKTQLIYAALNALQAAGIYGQYWTMPDLLDYLRDAIRDDCQDTASARLARLAALPVLAVDELDKFNATGWAEEQIHRLFNTRHQNRRLVGTLIGYNLDGSEKIPPFLRSRMRDGRYQLIELRGADLRPSATDDPEQDIDTPEEIWRKNP